jgi:hypothetical protein
MVAIAAIGWYLFKRPKNGSGLARLSSRMPLSGCCISRMALAFSC